MDDLREELANRLTLRDDARTDDPEAAWPEMSFELDDLRFAGAEPDVGIMSAYLDDYSVSFELGGRVFEGTLAEMAFVEALFEEIGPDITETRDELAKLVNELVEQEANEAEPPDYDDYD